MVTISINIIIFHFAKNENLNTCKHPYRDGNKMVQDPNFLEKLEKYINKIKPEATYFFNAEGNRVAVFIVDIQSADQIPSGLTLFSGMGAHVEFHPVVEPDYLKGIPQPYWSKLLPLLKHIVYDYNERDRLE